MGAFSPYGSKELLDAYFRGNLPVTTNYLALLTSPPIPQDTGATLVEPKVANGYGRKLLNIATAANWTLDSSGTFVYNTSTITFTGGAITTNAAWGRIVGFALVTTNTPGTSDTGKVRVVGELTPAQWINASDIVAFNPGVMRIMVL